MDRETRQFWAERRREMLRRDRQRRGGDPYLTYGLIALMGLGWLLQVVFPVWLSQLPMVPGGFFLFMLVSTILPGSLLSLVFAGVFIWLIGPAIESSTVPWQYLVIFFGAGLVGVALSHLVGGGLVGGSLAAFGIAGAYVRLMAGWSRSGATQWALVLLGINVLLSGFQLPYLAGMLGAFGAGYGLAMFLQLR
ncbi:hypothetical protein TPY_2626 [Sulfobacillus acidophilus TPY]|uniref:Rhomboid protease n=1 Tax=Sulfobacillus acidophilus (strain ATCC 700253 / DSM 10332 / NAL) TaxID=679936 RepID=G8TVA9_SULAD|nr:hypothetical protein TPY_2626 [Sulfobacillus acidophilus TPY]AEW04749.1 rhomboid protease [Sulfobacillus acidophilus DSM 10332]